MSTRPLEITAFRRSTFSTANRRQSRGLSATWHHRSNPRHGEPGGGGAAPGEGRQRRGRSPGGGAGTGHQQPVAAGSSACARARPAAAGAGGGNPLVGSGRGGRQARRGGRGGRRRSRARTRGVTVHAAVPRGGACSAAGRPAELSPAPRLVRGCAVAVGFAIARVASVATWPAREVKKRSVSRCLYDTQNRNPLKRCGDNLCSVEWSGIPCQPRPSRPPRFS